MTPYKKFKKLSIDTSSIGLITNSDSEKYFCTPKGAAVIGEEGVDGIHYCFVRNYGEIVFAVNPMGTNGTCVYPIAYNFTDFLSLILACKNVCIIEQIYGIDKKEFLHLIEQQTLSDEETKVLNAIKREFDIEPMKNPFEYVKEVQKETDLSELRFSREYYDQFNIQVPDDVDWNVYMSGSFYGHGKREPAGEEIKVDKRFEYIGRQWQIPSVYLFKKGIVVDVCFSVEREEIQKYMDKIKQIPEVVLIRGDFDDSDNPFNPGFSFSVSANNQQLADYERNAGYVVTTYNPLSNENESDDLTSIFAMEHYGLDTNKGWVFVRSSFKWGKKAAAKLEKLGVTIHFDEIPVPVLEFSGSDKDKKLEFVSPTDGEKYTLNILDSKHMELSEEVCKETGIPYPSFVEQIKYKILPEMSDYLYSVSEYIEKLYDFSDDNVSDCSSSDDLIGRETDKTNTSYNAAVIGGSDGPTAICFTFDDDSSCRDGEDSGEGTISFSQSICKPDRKIKWQLSIYKSPYEDKTIEINMD